MTARLTHLDALRGLAAVTVAAFHFLRAFVPEALGPSMLNASPASALWNGHFGVEVFFALSGYLFFWKFADARWRDALLAMPKRYLRLTLPALGACLVAWALLAGGFFANAQAAALSGSDWLARWYRFPPSLPDAAAEGLFTMYVAFDALGSYDANLWTIRYELFIVWAVIAAAAVMGRLPRLAQAAVALALVAIAWETYALSFALGAAVAWMRHWRTITLPAWLAAAFLVLACWMGAIIVWPGVVPRLAWPAAAALLVFTLDASPQLRSALSRKWLAVLGSLSFGLYLMHFIVLSSAASLAFLATRSLAVTFATYSVATVFAAFAFRQLFDDPTQRLLHRWFRDKERINPSSANPPPIR